MAASGLRSSCESIARKSSFCRTASCTERNNWELSIAVAIRWARSSASLTSLRVVRAVRFGSDKGHHADRLVANLQRHAQQRARIELPHQPQRVGIGVDLRQHLARQMRNQLWLARAKRAGGRSGRIGIERSHSQELGERLRFCGEAMGVGNRNHGPFSISAIDDAPIGEVRHREDARLAAGRFPDPPAPPANGSPRRERPAIPHCACVGKCRGRPSMRRPLRRRDS